MSLLLDALKKAADDKKNNSHDDDVSQSHLPADDHDANHAADDSLDLELQLEPNGDDSSLSLEVLPKDELLISDDTKSAPEPTAPPVSSPSTETTRYNPAGDTRYENTAALSALINKSNQLRAREKRRNLVAITTLVLLVIGASALFFFFDQQSQSQLMTLDHPVRAAIKQPTSTSLMPDQIKSNSTPPVNVQPAEPSIEKQQPGSGAHKTAAPVRAHVQPTTNAYTMQISQGTSQDSIHVQLKTAYSAFQHSELSKASRIYQDILTQESDNRDALLGLAAIAVKQNATDDARQLYQKILARYPDDSFAMAALTSLNATASNITSESELKSMIDQQPTAAHLHFALANLYARQQNWTQAQSSYFEAWSLQNNNADYSYNLAVSLDHLGKSQQALDFYEKSLQLAQHSQASFSSAAANTRIQSLRKRLR